MPYQLKQLAPDLVHVVMSGHVDKETAEIYHPEAWQLLDSCPKPTNIIMDAREVQSVCPVARNTVDKIRFHPHVGTIAFVVRHRYLLLFSPVVQIFSGFRMFGNEDEALAFFKRTATVQTIPMNAGFSSATSHATSLPSTVIITETMRLEGEDGVSVPIVNVGSPDHTGKTVPHAPTTNPVQGVVSFFSDMFKGMTCKIEDKPSMLE